MHPERRLLVALLVALAGCTTAEATPSPAINSEGPSTQSATPTVPSGSGPPSPAAGGGTFMQVVADALRLRSAAGIDASLVEALPRGALIRVESEPVEATGFRWREVVTINGARGWAADGDETDPWLAPVPDVGGGMPVVTLGTVCDVVGPLNPPTTVVMDDGWVVAPETATGGGWVARQLSSDGLEEVGGAVRGSPYLQASAEYVPEPKPGAEPPGHGACQYTFTVPTEGGDPIVVHSIGWFGDEEESEFYQPSPERRALDALAENLTNIVGVLDDEMWTGSALPYVPDQLVLRIEEAIGAPPPEGTPEIDPVALGLGDLDAFGAPSGNGRCATVSRAQAFELARVLNAAEPGFALQLNSVPTPYFSVGDRWFGVIMGPQLPGGDPVCPDS